MLKIGAYVISISMVILLLVASYFLFFIPLMFDSTSLPTNYGKVDSKLFVSETEVQPLVVVFGGSEGGNSYTKPYNVKERELYTNSGYAVLAVGYFGMKGIPQELDRISLNAVYDEIALTLKAPNVNSSCVAVMGGSKGAELALSLASKYPDITSVVSLSGGNVGFAGPSFFADGKTASYMFNDEPLPFVPFSFEMLPSLLTGDLRKASEIALENTEAAAKAEIKVEDINGPILLISGEKDQIWPSMEMSNKVMQRLSENNFPHPYKHIIVPDGNHFQPQNNYHKEVIAFLDKNFKPLCKRADSPYI